MRVRASIAVLLLSAAALTACATSGGSSPTTSGTASASAEQTPTDTPTPSPTIDSDDPSTWIITEDGMGPIALGDPFPEALALMPEGTRNDTTNCAWTAWWNAPDQSYQVFAARASDSADDGPVINVSTDSWSDPAVADGPRTAEGIGVGSTVDEVRAAYPAAIEMPDSIGPDIVYLKVGRIFFTYRETPVITSITVTTADVPPYEVCG
ncbi:hypothetical protein IF188_19620 [Microbacterium sp. NEAU-LLC]|uniref:Secreted protein n=1 Tax=Microbacterium helvum TaxID=2773713 RepID=A0ABR8NTG3_9MICO|nr:hypothetical protein [Microbacterium helvum]MBD3943905.1 hypothetical protein [Microbacterium helvum]